MSRPLFEITQDLVKLDDILDEQDSTFWTGDASKSLDAWFDAIGAEEQEKLDAYVALIKQNEMEAVAAKAEKEQWAQKEKARTAKAEWLKARLKNHLEITKRDKVKTAKGHTIAIHRNSAAPVIYDEERFNNLTVEEVADLVNAHLIILQPMMNKTEVKKTLEMGTPIPFAKLGEVGTHLRIR